ncbi:HD domain-containing protein [Candidatus Bathyarchaeota archaeon]|nr:HD domain-containing protein [Candidatus Bathyarchaeota archaeon]
MNPSLKGLGEFLRIVGRLKRLPRTGWLESRIEDPESVADHSFRTTVLAMILADLEKLDVEKVIRMALLHDLAEAEIGDLTPETKKGMREEYARVEREAFRRILGELPERLAEEYIELIKEYKDALTPEAKLVSEADKAEMLLQALDYEDVGVEHSRLRRFWETDLEDPLLEELLRLEKQKKKGSCIKS